MNQPWAIELDQLWTQFGDKIIHKDLNLRLRQGEILGLVGTSGSGKTTLLREMIGLQQPSQGRILMMGKPLPLNQSQPQLRSDYGVLFQKGALFSALDVFDNVAFPLREIGLNDDELLARLVFMKLALVGLSEQDAWLKPAALSGGMIKRVALARALILEPRLLLLDEPTAGLDPIASEAFVTLLAHTHQALQVTVVMVTHDLDILRDLCTQIAVLADQHIVALGTLADVLASPHQFVQDFFHNNRAQRVFQGSRVNHG